MKLLNAQNHNFSSKKPKPPLKQERKQRIVKNKPLHAAKKNISQFTKKLSAINQNCRPPFGNNSNVKLMNITNSGHKLKINSQQGLLNYNPANKILIKLSNFKVNKLDLHLNIYGLGNS